MFRSRMIICISTFPEHKISVWLELQAASSVSLGKVQLEV